MSSFRETLDKYNSVIGFVIGAIGIILSVLFYFKTISTREISYAVKDTSLVFNKQSSLSTIKVLDRNNEIIDGDIYLTKIVVWNSGSLPISPDDVREPLRIVIPSNVDLLDFVISQQTRPEISNFTASENVNSSSGNKSLELNWDYFDPGFGVELQILYIRNSNDEVAFNLEGYVLGVEDFTNAETLVDLQGQSGFEKFSGLFLVWISGITYSYLSYALFRSFRKENIMFLRVIQAIGLIILTVFAIFSLIAAVQSTSYFISLQSKGPPF